MKFSIIIPTQKIFSTLLTETIPAISNQTHPNWELILVPDKRPVSKLNLPPRTLLRPHPGSPAEKRDHAAARAKGDTLAFLDSDAYPAENWLKQAAILLTDPNLAAVCGPNLTPPSDPLPAQVSGYFWQSRLGAGGAGTYRNRPAPPRFVDDFPASNLIIKKDAFTSTGGFNTNYWPGEDTKLCHDLTSTLNKKILYHPKLKVFHHRRPIYLSHLQQLTRFGLHRGAFARLLPKTSRRLGYFLPTVFALGFILTPIAVFSLYINQLPQAAGSLFRLYLLLLAVYLLALLVTGVNAYLQTRRLLLALHLAPTIFLSHLTYGGFFFLGFILPRLITPALSSAKPGSSTA